jgi:two-component system chemotaxis response regulator CheY
MRNILVIDDAEFFRHKISQALMGAGYNVLQAQNIFEGLQVYEDKHPELVIMDIAMPEMDIPAAIRRIKTSDPLVTVLVVSRLGQEGSVLEALAAGADDFLVKPVDGDRMVSEITQALAA